MALSMPMPMSMPLLSLAMAALLGWAAPACAQVVRCSDARTGAVTYTDGTCPSASRAQEVQARQTPEEIAQERAQAAQALAEKQQRQQIQAAADEREAQRQAQRQREQAERAAAPTPTQTYARSPECARSRRNFDLAASSANSARYAPNVPLQAAQRQMELDCLGPEGYAAVEKNRPAPSPLSIVVYPPTRWRPHQYPPYPHRPRPPRPPYPPPPPEHPPRPPGAQQRSAFAPLPSFAPMPSPQNPAVDRRCIGRGCDEKPR